MTTSAERVEAQAAYLLHSRPYRETSALADYFTAQQGRIRGVLRGVRQPRARKRELLREFQPLELGWHGRGELKSIRDGEVVGLAHPLLGRALWCGLYLNELLVRLLPLEEPHPRLFALYRFSLEGLTDPDTAEAVLRIFEKRLLEELGFGISFDQDRHGTAINPGCSYRFDPHEGFEAQGGATVGRLYSGAILLAIAADDYGDGVVRLAAKRLMREALALHLGARPLKSRALFQGQPGVTAGEREGQGA